jgi:hypothetical protein
MIKKNMGENEMRGTESMLMPAVLRNRRSSRALWTPLAWPGALLVQGELVGTRRRAKGDGDDPVPGAVSRAARDAVQAEAESLSLPGIRERIVVRRG